MGSIFGIDLQAASLGLCEDLALLQLEHTPPLSIIQQWANTSSPTASQSQLLDALSYVVLHPLCTQRVSIHFHALLLDILLRAIHRSESSELGWSDESTRQLYHALARLLHPFPFLMSAARLFLAIPSLQPAPILEEAEELDAFLLSTYRLTRAAPSILVSIDPAWSSKAFLQVARSSSSAVSDGSRLLALHIFGRIEAVSEATLEEMQIELIGQPRLIGEYDEKDRNAVVEIFHNGGAVEEVDAWVIPMTEMKRVKLIRKSTKELRTGSTGPRVQATQLTSTTTCLGGHLFYRPASILPTQDTYKETERLQPTLCSFGEKLAARLPILLSGPEACGKTSLIRHACSLLNTSSGTNHIITLQLGDQSGIDAKSLIGSFVSSTKKPGTFEWAEGVLTRALRLGKWIVLEDVDRASGEVLSVIKPLVEDMCKSKTIDARPSLDLGSRGRVEAGDTFALFATRTTPSLKRGSDMPKATFFGHDHWNEVKMEALNEVDILEIVKSSNVLLSLSEDDTISRIVNTWLKLVGAASNRSWSSSSRDHLSTGTIRVPSFHDLLKWCRRIEASLQRSGSSAHTLARAPLSNQAMQEEIAIEACDIFLGSSPSSLLIALTGSSVHAKEAHLTATDRYTAMVNLLAEEIGVDSMALWHNVAERRPECKMESNREGEKTILIGRGQIRRSTSSDSSSIQPISRNFALTAPAARLMEKIAICVSLREPTLIVGETGTGKTTIVQHLASLARKPMIALNLSQQTETSDLLGGFKPLDPKLPAMEIHNDWIDLFQQTFSSRRNARFLQAERKALQSEKWSRLYGTWKESVRLALDKLTKEVNSDLDVEEEQRAFKTRRLTNGGDKQEYHSPPPGEDADLLLKWNAFRDRIELFAVQHTGKKRHLIFSFVEGPLVKAIRMGAWVLLDEINLATSETLDCLTALLQAPDSSIVLTERGDLEPVPRHADFRLFACMNPATDVGKKDLPSSLRSRFTELYAPSPDSDQEALVAIVEQYIGQESVGDRATIMDVAQCYAQIRQLSLSHQLADGANQRPHYSIRTLSRALIFAKDICAVYGLRRAVWEGFIMTFTMLLDEKSAVHVRDIIGREILSKAKNANSAANFVPPKPMSAEGTASNYVQLGSFWIGTGGYPLESAEEYILTPSVQDKLVGLARAALTRKSPVLIQGPTSAGKTSAIEYLARRTGHKFVRINNHEHTDIQEYIGSYASDPDSGRLVFHEGLLVTALRQGHWIVLDELNLAPTDVLEALNRLLDDNRELLIPETGQTVKPHPHFMLFATQNPPGLYAGRKVLSRAFRNRFLEIHFQDVPQTELQTILTKRCRIAPSYAEKIVQVFRELQRRRQTERVFDTKQAFVTLRDLFRWGNREAENYQQLAENGYMLIAERARRSDDALVVQQVIEEVINVKIDTDALYDVFNGGTLARRVGEGVAVDLLSSIHGTSIVWTRSMQRLVCLIASALRYNEPVLLVGETGSGKTSVCEVVANGFDRSLLTVNCHQSTDTADLIGSQRPLRNRSAVQEAARKNGLQLLQESGIAVEEDISLESVSGLLSKLETVSNYKQLAQQAISKINHSLSLFEWSDGPLVHAMRDGQHLLLDEISLADDSVLERLNSVLEPGRSLVLAERSSAGATESLEIKSNDLFQVVATMNPGGDYGKKELSPALRNRFTEIWVPSVQARHDLMQIINSQWRMEIADEMKTWSGKMVDFLSFYSDTLGGRDANAVGLRDLIAWARFITILTEDNQMSVGEAFAHGACMTFIDGVAVHPWVASKPKHQIRSIILTLSSHIFDMAGFDTASRDAFYTTNMSDSPTHFSIGKFACPKGDISLLDPASSHFNLQASTPAMNAVRVLRAMQIKERAVMLEGSPGAGKTSLIVAISKACNHKLTRINLSDQTELSDLFGADLPVEGGKAGEFDWRDAAFLQAMQEGSWVLLDEMNLASQSVLEGLNSCLDHRGAVFIPELSRSFTKHPNFRIFAAQNPQHQGGGRKGLPKSFLNRFTKVYVEELHDEDFNSIVATLYPDFDKDVLSKMIKFNGQLQSLLQDTTLFSKAGQPWEFNLRDLLRWQSMMTSQLGLNLNQTDPLEYFGSLYVLRFRSRQDRVKVARLYHSIFAVEPKVDQQPWIFVSPRLIQLGHVVLQREQQQPRNQHTLDVAISKNHLAALQALGECVRLGWPSILVGESRSGKTSLLRRLAQLTNRELEEVRLNSGTDAIDVIGGFQQVDGKGEATQILCSLLHLVQLSQTTLTFLITSNAEDQNFIWQAKNFLRTQIAQMEAGEEGFTLAWSEAIDVAIKLQQLSQIPSQSRTACALAANRLSELQRQEVSSTSGKFAWIDGPVLRAMRKGSWLLLDDANLCSSSVLDRLNSLLEPGGNLVLSERGVVEGDIEVVKPHADFRIFFALDPRYGELSRAMRNRGLEVFIERFEDREDAPENLQEVRLRDVQRWTHLIEAVEPSYNHKTSMLLALLGSGCSSFSLALTRRALDYKQYRHLEAILDDKVVIDQSKELKTILTKMTNVDHAFLQETALDLQLNPCTFRDDSFQKGYSHQLQLLVKTSTFLSHLLDVAAVHQSTPSIEPLTVLQKSFLYCRGQEVEQLPREDRHFYSLIESIANGLNRCLRLSSKIALEALEACYSLLDCSIYLAMKWSNSPLNDYSVTKILLGKIEAARNDLLKFGISSIHDMERQLEAVSKQVALTSGFAMQQIWRAFLPSLVDAEATDLAVTIGQHLLSKNGNGNPDLISNSVDVAATLWQVQSEWSDEHRSELTSVARRIIVAMEVQQRSNIEKPLKEPREDDAVLLSILLLAVGYSTTNSSTDIQRRSALVDLAKTSTTFPVQVAIPLRAFLSINKEDKRLTSTLFATDLSWVQQIFKSAPFADGQSGNTQDLFRPILLQSVLKQCLPSLKNSFVQVQGQQDGLKRLAAIVGHISPAEVISRSQSFSALLQIHVSAVTDLLLNTLRGDVRGVEEADLVKAIDSTQSPNERLQLVNLLITNTLASSSTTGIALSLRSCLELASILEKQVEETETCRQTGLAAIRFGLVLINSYLPNIAIDPLVTQRTEDEYRQYRVNRLQEERAVVVQVENSVTGNESNNLTDEIDQLLSVLAANSEQADLQMQSTPLKRVTNTDLLQKLYRELLSFSQQILTPAKVEELLEHLDSDSAQGRLLNLQSTICAMLDRLPSIYGSLWDLTRPIEHALSILLLGLGLLLQSLKATLTNNSTTRLDQILSSIVAFPTSLASSQYSQLEIPLRIKADTQLGSLAVPLLLLRVRAVVFDMKHGEQSLIQIDQLKSAYDQLWYLWTLDEEHQQQQREEERSLYKVKKLDMSAEEEDKREEEEFLSFFPQYTDIMEESHFVQSNGVEQKSPAKKGTFFKSEHLLQLFNLHLAYFEQESLRDADSFEQARVGIAQSLMHSNYPSMSEELDRRSASLQVSLLYGSLYSNQDTNDRDFYSESNRTEAIKMHTVVTRIVRRLEELIKDWPDQEVLHHIKQRSERILDLDSSSPVNQMLAALEGLLVHTEDWQIYASSRNSLQRERDEIVALIIEWRRLELRGWKGLLNKESNRCRDGVCEMWFTLFQVVAKVEYKEEESCSELVSLLDQYLRGSTLGQYSIRLKFVHSLAGYLRSLRTHLQEAKWQQAELTLNNVYRFFAQFESAINDKLTSKRKLIEKDIADYVKLASWKDTNIHALKVSAAKTHRKLHRSLRKFRDALNEAVDPVLAALKDAKHSHDKQVEEVKRVVELSSLSRSVQKDVPLSWHDGNATPAHLVSLPSTLKTLHSVYQRDISPLLEQGQTTDALLDLSSTIISRKDALAKQTPTIWKEENDKLVKHLETRKRKAWSDLLRELRRIGLTVSSIDGISTEHLTKSSFIYSLSLSEEVTCQTGSLEEAHQIHYRLLSLLPVLRSTIHSSSRNEDIHVSQLTKGLSFVENCFLASLNERQKLSEVSSQLKWIRQVQDRVNTLTEEDSTMAKLVPTSFNDHVHSRLLNRLDLWARLQSALEEIQAKAMSHAEVLPFGKQAFEETLKMIGECQEEVALMKLAVGKLVDCFGVCRSTLMSAKEAEQMRGSSLLIQKVETALQTAIETAPSLRSMCIPTFEWVSATQADFYLVPALPMEGNEMESLEIGRQSDRIISSLLVIAQELRKLSKPLVEGQDNGNLPDRGIVEERLRLTSVQNTLRLSHLTQEIQRWFTLADREESSTRVIRDALQRLAPFLDMYRIFIEDFVDGCSRWYRGLLKLDLTLCQLIISLASNGFCKPRQEEEQSGEAGTEDDQQLEGGMGLGEGEGAQDVTDTLQDDEMMEELESEEKEEKGDGETKGEKNAREMQDDFDGDMGDVEKDEDEEQGEGREDEKEDGDEIESAVGDVDPLDLDAVDEKTWGGQDEDKKDEGKDKSEREMEGKTANEGEGEESKEAPQADKEEDKGAEGAGQRGQEGEQSKEEEGKQSDEAKQEGEEKSQEEGQEMQGDEQEEEEMAETGAEEQDEEDKQGEGLGRAIDQEAQQTENLDLDDDLKLEDGDNDVSDGEGESDMDGLSAMGDDEKTKADDDPLSADEQDLQEEMTKTEKEDADESNPAQEEEDEPQVPHGQGEEPMEVDEEEEASDVDDSAGPAEANEKDQMANQDSGLVDDTAVDDSAMAGDASQDNPANQQQSTKSAFGRQAAANETSASGLEGEAEDEEEAPSTESNPKKEEGKGGGSQRKDQGNQGQGEEEKTEEAQPSRSLGDALKEFKRNMDAIEERLMDEAREDGAGMSEEEDVSQVEHIRNDHDSEMQALGAAQEEEALHKLNDVKIEGDEMETEEEIRIQVDEEIKQLEAKEEWQPNGALEEDDQEGKDELQGGGLTTSDVQPSSIDQGNIELEVEDMISEKNEEEPDSLDEVIESQMEILFASKDSQDRLEVAQELWKAYLEATADYAFTLSEQLRLILAPTKATKLTGDFKTGKRLNMRKIIPFIASDYLKDKIWLRRNLPQKREYQVLLSIDDSKSMLESKNMLLAFKSLALVCSALDKLGVGQIGVMKFGKEIELLRGFEGETIREQEGGKILDRLQFQQKGTDVSAMLQSSYKVLMEARESQSTTASQLWQLQIIISDGICQDHQKLQALLRRASEEHIMIVFVILDSLQQNGSILTMNSVQYTTSVNGRPTLQMTRYLDSFPFEYFVVVRDVADLPDVLSTTLRQWAQKIAEA